MFISKYQKTLQELTQVKPSVQQPTKQREITKKKVPTYIPPEIFRIILSFLPKITKPIKYGVMNGVDGYFGIIHKTTKCYITYSLWRMVNFLGNGESHYYIDNHRKLIRKNKEKHSYYIKDDDADLFINNERPKQIITKVGFNQADNLEYWDELDYITDEKLKNIYRALPDVVGNDQYFGEALPVKLKEVAKEKIIKREFQ